MNKDILNNKQIRLSIGSSHWKLGDLEKAIETLEELRNDYDYVNSNVLVILEYMYLLIDNTDKALSILELVDSNYFLGVLYEQQNDVEKAKEYYKKAIKSK